MKKRIYGLENEFGIAFTSHGRRDPTVGKGGALSV